MKKLVSNSDQSILKKNTVAKWVPYLLFLLAFLIYSNTLNHHYTCDDGYYTHKNIYVSKGISSFHNLVTKGTHEGCISLKYDPSYRPLVLVNLALERTLFGKGPGVGHFFNVLIYAFLCLLVYNFTRKIFKEFPFYLPVIITTLFILHPIHTEVVANIKGRDEILSMLFGMLSLIYIFDYVKNNNIRFLVYSALSFFLCISSKENGYAFLLLIPLVIYFFTPVIIKRIFLITLPFIAIAFIGILIRIYILGAVQSLGPATIMENSLLAATNTADRLATNFTMLFHAVYLLFFPATLSWDYSYNQFPIVGWSNLKAIISIILHLFLIVIATLGLKKRNIFSFAILFYFITSFIASNVVIKIGTAFGERFLFSPSLAFCIALPFLIATLFRIQLKTVKWAEFQKFSLIIIFIFIVYAIRTYARNKDWKDDKTLYASGIETSPNSARTHLSYANYYFKRLQTNITEKERSESAKIALAEYQIVVDINAKEPEAYYNMGIIYYKMGDTAQAGKMFKKSLEIKPNDIRFLVNYASLLLIKKDYTNALPFFIKASLTQSDSAYFIINTGIATCYQNLKEYKIAALYYEKVLRKDSSNIKVLKSMSETYAAVGDSLKAKYYLDRANR